MEARGLSESLTMSVSTSECPACGRRYLPARRFCVGCSLIETRPTRLRPTGVVLHRSMLHRAGKEIVTPLPSLIAMIREFGDGATFWAPVEGNMDIPPGTPVALRTKTWTLPDGSNFTAIVVQPKEATE